MRRVENKMFVQRIKTMELNNCTKKNINEGKKFFFHFTLAITHNGKVRKDMLSQGQSSPDWVKAVSIPLFH